MSERAVPIGIARLLRGETMNISAAKDMLLVEVPREFQALDLKGKLICIAEMVVGYFIPLAGIIAYVYLRKKDKAHVYRFAALVGVVIALVFFVVEFAAFVAANGQ